MNFLMIYLDSGESGLFSSPKLGLIQIYFQARNLPFLTV